MNVKRIILLISICAGFASIPGSQSLSGNLTFTLRMSPDDVTLRPAEDGTTSVEAAAGDDGWARLDDDGRPALPYRIVQVLVPDGQAVDGVSAVASDWEEIGRGIQPVLAHTERKPDAPPVMTPPPLAPDGAGPGTTTVRYLGTGTWHGRAIASFAVFPVRLDDGTLYVAPRVELTVRTVPQTGAAATKPRRMVEDDARRVDAALDATVINPEAKASYAPLPTAPRPRGGFNPTIAPSLEGSPVEMVIITTDAMAAAYQRLADWRTARGTPTVVRTIDWIEANYRHGSDTPETIRNFIRDAYTKWGTEYFLLGGDTQDVPTRYLRTDYYYGGTDVCTDIYYEGLDGTWNADRDAVYGEHDTDAPDLYTEVFVSRLPTSTAADVDVQIDKIIDYETGAVMGYSGTALMLAEVVFPTPWNYGDDIQYNGATTAEYIKEKHLVPAGIQITRLYETDYLYPGSYPESRLTAIDSLNVGYNFVYHFGHGFRFNMHCADESVVISDADALVNGQRQFNLVMLNCTANAFDYDCLGEHFLRNPNGGAVSVLGATNSTFVSAATYYLDEYSLLLFDDGVTRVPEALALARVPRIPIAIAYDNADYWTQLIYRPLADPALQLFTGSIDTFVVSHPDTITTGTTNIQVTVTSGGAPFDSARVCLWKSGEDYQIADTDAGGVASFWFTAETPGSLSVTVTGHNRAAKTSSIAVTATPGSYLALDGTVVDDDSAGGTFGNGDGVIDAGETVDLTPQVHNTGDATSLPATLTLSTVSPYVTLIDSTATVGAIPASQTTGAGNAWRISIDAGAPDGTSAPLGVSISDGNATWNQEIARVIHTPALELTALRVDDSVLGNNDGSIDSLEPFQLYYSVKNYGTGAASGLTATLADAGTGGVNVSLGLANYPELSPLEEAENLVGFELYETSVLSENPIAISVTDLFGRTVVDTFELRRPAPPANLAFDASLGEEKILITWDASPSPDADRYYVYHATTSGGPYTRATVDAVHSSTFTDEGLPPSTRFYYVVTTIDSSGNESVPSPESSASTNPPQANGWPNSLADPSTNSPILGDIDGDNKLEVIVGNNLLYAWYYNGTEVRDGDGEALTYGVFSDQGSGFVAPVALAKIDDDFGLDIVAASWSTKEIYVFNHNGTVLPGWPQPTLSSVRASMVVGDIDGDGEPDIVAIDQEARLYAWHADGTEIRDGDSNPATSGVFRVFPDTPWWQYQAPSLADLDNDGKDEIIVGTQDEKLYVVEDDGSDAPGWPRTLSSYAGGGVAVGDIDNDGGLDIVCPTKNSGEILALHADNTLLWIRWCTQNQFFNPSPALADIDGDGTLETFLPSDNGKLYGFASNGADLPGWPVTYSTTTYTESSPVIADVTGDGVVDILLGDETRFINGWSADGTPLEGFPLALKDAVRGTPAIADLDGDGTVEIVCAGYDGSVNVWDLSAAYDGHKAPWPMFKGNWHRNGVYDFAVPTAVGSERVPVTRAALEQNYPNPFNPTTTIVFYVPESAAGAATPARRVRLVVYDVTGARVRTIVDRNLTPGRYTMDWDGTNDRGQHVGSGVYFYRLEQGRFNATRKMVLLK